MSFFDLYSRNSFIVGCGLVLGGFSAGFAVNQYFSDHLHKVESIETGRMSEDVATLQQQVLAKEKSIQMLSSELASARNDVVRLQNQSGSENVSCQLVNDKYYKLSNEYNQLTGMYSSLNANYRKASQNCNALSRIDFLEQRRRNLENQLSSVSYDAFEKDPSGKKRDIEFQLQQNHEQLLSLQRQLSR